MALFDLAVDGSKEIVDVTVSVIQHIDAIGFEVMNLMTSDPSFDILRHIGNHIELIVCHRRGVFVGVSQC